MKKIPVLIVGAGPVGLSMALALARQNVASLVIEKHQGRAEHPRARGVSMRSMELFRQWGDIDELLKYEFPKEAIRFIWAESLQGKEITRVEIKDMHHYPHGPITASFVTQDCVEVYLHQTLQAYQQTEIQFAKELLSFEQDDADIIVKILNRNTNQEEMIQAQYLIAADGAQSTVRKQLNIEMIGPDNLGRFCNVYCEFDIAEWTAHRSAIGYFFANPKLLSRSLFTSYGKNRWIFGMRMTAENKKEDFTDDYCLQEIRRVLNLPDLYIKIINKNFWTMAAQIAKEYQKDKIFLVGDAAHRLPPTGGLGMNTGIQDAHNLAWKLAHVLQHKANADLLATYEIERQPIAKRNMAWSSENAKRFVDIGAAIHAGDTETLKIKLQEQQNNLNYEGLDLGFIYHSNNIISESDDVMSVAPNQYIATTLPGARAPHVPLLKNNKVISTLDLFEQDYVLLVGNDGQDWQKAAAQLAVPLKTYRVAQDGDLVDAKDVWQKTYEISSKGAVLVRPDGHVAWRSKAMVQDPESTLREVVMKIGLIFSGD